MVQRTELKVHISCRKCKKKLLKAVSSLQGVDKIELDEAKGTLTVTGSADPYNIIVRTRKAGMFAEVVSVGPPPPPPKPEEKKPETKPSQTQFPHNCPTCNPVAVVYLDRYDDPNPVCSLM